MTRQRFAILIAASLAALLYASRAEARPYHSDKGFGMGLMVGAPTGLSAKYYMDAPVALAGGVGEYYDLGDDDGLHLHLDVLWHPVVLGENRALTVPLYLGVGGRLLDHDHFHVDHYHDYTAMGVRMPLGVALDFRNVPLDVFFELAFVVDLVEIEDDDFDDDHHDRTDLTGALGLRYYF